MKGPSVLADVVIGAHGELTEWVFDFITALASTDPNRPVRRIDRFDHVDFLADPRPVYLTHYPSKQMIDAIESGDIRVHFVTEPPEEVLAYMRAVLGLPLMEAIRSQTASAVANLAIGRAEQVHFLHRHTERNATQVAQGLARNIALSNNDHHIASALAEVSAGVAPDTTIEKVLCARRATDSPLAMIANDLMTDPLGRVCTQIMAPLLAMARCDITRPVVWPTSVFKFIGEPEAPAPQVSEISGPVRNLYYGPYLFLPPARYRVEAILAFSDEIKDVPFVLEVHGGSWLAKARIEQRKPGNYRGYFLLDHREPTATVEIRLRNEREIAKGRLSLLELLFFVDGDA